MMALSICCAAAAASSSPSSCCAHPSLYSHHRSIINSRNTNKEFNFVTEEGSCRQGQGRRARKDFIIVIGKNSFYSSTTTTSSSYSNKKEENLRSSCLVPLYNSKSNHQWRTTPTPTPNPNPTRDSVNIPSFHLHPSNRLLPRRIRSAGFPTMADPLTNGSPSFSSPPTSLTTSNHLRHVESMATLPSGAGRISKLNAVILGEALASEEDDLIVPSQDFSAQAHVPSPDKVHSIASFLF